MIRFYTFTKINYPWKEKIEKKYFQTRQRLAEFDQTEAWLREGS